MIWRPILPKLVTETAGFGSPAIFSGLDGDLPKAADAGEKESTKEISGLPWLWPAAERPGAQRARKAPSKDATV